MRRKLAYSNPALTDTIARFGSLPQGDWHISKTGGILFVGDTDWKRIVRMKTANEAVFHLDKTTSMLVQAQDRSTCRNIAIESKPAYDAFVSGGGASGLLRQGFRAILTFLRRVTADEDQEPIRRSALRADNANMDSHGPACRHTGRQALEIQLSSTCELDTAENVKLSAGGADACKRMEVHTLGVLGLALLVARWSAGRGRIQGDAEYRQHPDVARVRGHANRHVLHRFGRVADFAGGWRSYLRRRHRTLLNVLGVAA